MGVGETLEVVADDPAADSDIHSLVKRLGQEIVSSTNDEGGAIRIVIKKIK
jgi:TusA-related sulfurtransferase